MAYETPAEFMRQYPEIKHLKISTPSGRHKCFRVYGQIGKKYITVRLASLTAANKLFLEKVSTHQHTYEKVKDIVRQLNACKPKIVFNSDNLKVMEAFWSDKYPPSRQRKMESPEHARREIIRAIEAIGDHSIVSADVNVLQDEIDKLVPSNQRRVASQLNSILSYLGRKERLVRYDKPRKQIKHITKADLLSLLATFNEPFRTLVGVAFHTGLRCGEIFGLTSDKIKPKSKIWVDLQIRRNNKEGKTKNKKEHHTILAPGGKKFIEQWLNVSAEEKEKLRNFNHSKEVKKQCKKLWPNDKIKHCTFHDLRHSYAIHLAKGGITVSDIAQCLGNSVSVCEEYYRGYAISDYTAEKILELLEKAE